MSASEHESPSAWPAILTWRAQQVSRMESVRVQLSGNRLKAYGRIVIRYPKRSLLVSISSGTLCHSSAIAPK